jgi:hypothetical protein
LVDHRFTTPPLLFRAPGYLLAASDEFLRGLSYTMTHLDAPCIGSEGTDLETSIAAQGPLPVRREKSPDRPAPAIGSPGQKPTQKGERMSTVASTVAKRPAETTTGVTAAIVAILVATTHVSTGLSTALVIVVGALPGFVTAIVSATRSTAAGDLLVSLTPKVHQLAESALDSGLDSSASAQNKTAALQDVTNAVASWTTVLADEPGAKASAKRAQAAKAK